jgi:PPK2 family polyphosphate:nucleotide phosphotransferase
MMLKKYTLDKGKTIKLNQFEPGDTDKYNNNDEIHQKFKQLVEKLQDYQDKLFASKTNAVLILFQGMDCSGKDGVIKNVLSHLNPQGFRAESFKRPTEEELAHDFLWRTHKVMPQKGYITAFNRSYYEDVLVTRVHNTIPDKEAAKRLKHIQHFEKLQADNGVLVIKIFLHISQKFQLEKLTERIAEPEKHWKFDPNDLQERKHWEQYVKAYEDIFAQTGKKSNPWYIVPADERWFRDYVVLKIIVTALEQLNLQYPKIDLDTSSFSLE